MSELVASSAPSVDPLDLQDLWPITTDLVNATQSASASIIAIARSLSEDLDAGAATLRQQLLEIRARLVYLLVDVVYSVITHTSTLLLSGAVVMSKATPCESPEGRLTVLESQWTRVLKACVTNRGNIEDCILAWGSFHASLCDHRHARSRREGPLTSLLRAFGARGGGDAAPEDAASGQPDGLSNSGVESDLRSMGECLTQIEAFWRKRQSLFVTPGHVCEGERLPRNSSIWAQLGGRYTSFDHPIYTCIDAMRIPEPVISKFPDTLSESIKWVDSRD
ncbi:hypothetical protein AURDEDRAFT_183343 [Auricularia subglabra TFB-10046 SS5]|nr:hypothetical protein AURDEDRAFT_183343 [Auricularia subglabra TFB-10046 SS5]